MSSHYNAYITGTGAALPEQVLSNHDLEKMVDTSDQWIVSRTGIKERRKLEAGFSNTDLSEKAAKEALDRAGLDPGEVEMILVATVTPDYPTPAASCLLQARLNAFNACAMDLSAGCTGFIYALTVANQFICSGFYKNILVVGAEILTRVTDWQDRSTCVLFGDGAGAAVVQSTLEDRGIKHCSLKADGRGAELLYIPAGGSKHPASSETLQNRMHYVRMNGNEIFKFAVSQVENILYSLLEKEGLKPAHLDLIILHQANLRIIDHVRKHLKLPPEKFPVNIDRLGNTSSATIPIAMHEEVVNGRLNKGDLVAMVGFGAGLTWGGILMEC